MFRSRRTQRLAILLLIALVAVGAWILWPRPSDQQLILDLMATAEHGVETKNANEIMKCVARDYHDAAGLDRTDLFRLAFRWQQAPEEADIAITSYDLNITPPTATGQFEVDVTISEGGAIHPPEHLSLTLKFARERSGLLGKKWVVKSATGHGLEHNSEGFL